MIAFPRVRTIIIIIYIYICLCHLREYALYTLLRKLRHSLYLNNKFQFIIMLHNVYNYYYNTCMFIFCGLTDKFNLNTNMVYNICRCFEFHFTRLLLLSIYSNSATIYISTRFYVKYYRFRINRINNFIYVCVGLKLNSI